MLAKAGDKVGLINRVSYGSAYGLVEVLEGTVLTVYRRNSSNDGIESVETIFKKNAIGEKNMRIHIWDRDYIVLDS